MRKRHTTAEVTALLDRAQEMAAQGRLQSDIAKTLGVSIMTYHRWRKARGAINSASPASATLRAHGSKSELGELYIENSRLRHLVADLLLEKVKLEESLQGRSAIHGIAGRP